MKPCDPRHGFCFACFFSSLSFLKMSFNSTLLPRCFSSHQVARTITNMQQQIQQHQRQLYQALLMKQQQLPSHANSSSSSTGLHPPGGSTGGPVSTKSTLDPFTGPQQAQGLADSLHTKEPLSSANAYSSYPLCESGMDHQRAGVVVTRHGLCPYLGQQLVHSSGFEQHQCVELILSDAYLNECFKNTQTTIQKQNKGFIRLFIVL